MLRSAVAIGIISAMVICAAFGFYLTELEFDVEPGGERVVVCRMPSKLEQPSDKYAIACARAIGWIMQRKVRIDYPTSTYTGHTTINEQPIPPPRPTAGPVGKRSR